MFSGGVSSICIPECSRVSMVIVLPPTVSAGRQHDCLMSSSVGTIVLIIRIVGLVILVLRPEQKRQDHSSKKAAYVCLIGDSAAPRLRGCLRYRRELAE